METSHILWLLLALLLPVSALMARGLPAERVVRLIVIWTVIIAGIALAIWAAQRSGWIGSA